MGTQIKAHGAHLLCFGMAIYMEFMFLSHVNKNILAFRFFILSARTLKYPKKMILNLCHPHGYFGCPKAAKEIKLFFCVCLKNKSLSHKEQ